MCKEPRPEGLSPVFEEYENGKHRRYELLFKVNGAAFVIAGLFAKADSGGFIAQIISLRDLAILMCIFNFIMGIDIFAFGWGMKQIGMPESKRTTYRLFGKVTKFSEGVFKPAGWIVLWVIVFLIIAGWVLVAYYNPGAVSKDCPPKPAILPSTIKYRDKDHDVVVMRGLNHVVIVRLLDTKEIVAFE